MSDIITFADAKFKEYLVREDLHINVSFNPESGFDYSITNGKIEANGDGEISIAEAKRVEYIKVPKDLGITDISDLPYFPKLKILSLTFLLRISKYLYFNLKSSLTFLEEIISNGNSLLDLPNTTNSLTNNSISPVCILVLKGSSSLFLIVPVTLITLSFVNFLKMLSSLLTTLCLMNMSV